MGLSGDIHIFLEVKERVENEFWPNVADNIVRLAEDTVNTVSYESTGNLGAGFEFTFSGFNAQLTNDQIASNGFEYFQAWFEGRGEIRPVNTQALYFEGIFTQYAGPFDGHGDVFMSIFENELEPILEDGLDSLLNDM
jgi:hypothetical protein